MLPTEHFTILESQNAEIDVSKIHNIRGQTDLKLCIIVTCSVRPSLFHQVK